MILQLRNSPSFEHTQSQSFRKLDHDFSLYLQWEQTTLDQIKTAKCKLSSSKLRQAYKDLKARTLESHELSQLRFEFFKKQFTNKLSIEQAEQILNSAKSLFIQNKNEIDEIQNSISNALNLKSEFSQAHKQKKPIKFMKDKLIRISQSCVKPKDIDEMLEKFKICHELKCRAKNFLVDKIEENTIWLFEMYQKKFNLEDIIQKFKRKRIPLKHRYPHMVFSDTQVESLFAQAMDPAFCLDSKVRTMV